jgi:hypothetical protein
METAVAVIGTLLGAGIGVAGAYRTQRLSLRVQADERDRANRQDAYGAFLSAVHEMFEQIRAAQRQNHADGDTGRQAVSRLRAVSPVRAQIALEGLRFVASPGVAAAAAALWEQMRRSDVPIGKDLSSDAERRWRDGYWATRRGLIDAARKDAGREALDWQTAGVGPTPR